MAENLKHKHGLSHKQSIRKASGRHRLIHESIPEKNIQHSLNSNYSLIISIDGDILFANDGTLEKLGFDGKKSNVHNYYSLIGNEDAKNLKKVLKKLIKTGNYESEVLNLSVNNKSNSKITQVIDFFEIKDEQYFRITLENKEERLKLELELNKTKRFLEGIINNLPVTVFVKDAKQGRFLIWNEKCETLFGLKSEDALGKTDFDFFPKEQAEFFRKKDIEVLESGKVIEIPEEPIDSPLLGRRYLHTIKVPIYDDNNIPVFLLGFSEDITDRLAAEEARKISAALYTSLFERLPIGLYRTKKDGTILEANPALVKMLGYPSREKFLEQNTKDIYPDEKIRIDSIGKIKKKGQVYDFVVPLKKMDGNIIWVRDKTQLIEDEINEECYEGFLEDFTARKQAEEALIESESKFRSMFEQSLDGLLLMNDKGKVIECNVAAEKILGYPFELINDKPVYDILFDVTPQELKNPDLYENLKNSFISYFETGIYPWEKKWVERNIELNDGTKRAITSLIFPIKTNNRLIFCKILDDITERKKAEEEVNNLNRSLENKIMERTAMLRKSLLELNEEIELRKKAEKKLTDAKEKITEAFKKERELSELKSRFISMISHEYRTPLTIIMTSTFLLEKYYNVQDSEKFGEKIDMIQSSVQNMAQMLENVLLVGKGEKGSVRTRLKNCNVENLCEQVIEEVQIINKYGHNIELLINGDFKNVKTDEMMLHSILINLLINSVNYSPGNEDIRLDLKEIKSGIEIKIIDQGIGIPPTEKPFIFDSFFRGTNTGISPGFGVGLTIVRTCVEELKGEISVTSELYKGTTVTVNLPYIVDYV